MKSNFKDKCDICNTWQFNCWGYNDLILCPNCIKNKKELKNNKKIYQKQLNLFDFDKKLSQNSHSINDIM